MFKRLRQKTIGTCVLAALLGFLAGPAFSLHVLGDATHSVHAHHQHDLDAAGLIEFSPSGSGHACPLDHDHDHSDTANMALASLTPPQTVATVTFSVIAVLYDTEEGRTPPSATLTAIDRPPRLTASV